MSEFPTSVFAVLGGVAAVALVAWWVKSDSKTRARKMESAFAGREPLTPQGLYEKSFRARGVPPEIVQGVREIFEVELDADMSRLRAEDDLTKDLHFLIEMDSMLDVELVSALEKRFGIEISDREAQQARTILEIVELVSSKVGTRKAL